MRATTRLVLALVLAVALAGAAVGGVAAAAGAAHTVPGTFVWKKTANPGKGADSLQLCARGLAGAVYAAGSQGDYPDADIWVVKYAPNGAPAWSRTWAGPDGGYDEVRGMVADAAGNVYLCGQTARTSGDGDSLLLKYDAAGSLVWATVYDADSLSDEAEAIGLDAAGGVYVAGWSETSVSTMDIYTAKFGASDGVHQWTSRFGGSGLAGPRGIAVTEAGDCYVSGHSGDVADAVDAVLVKTTAAGDQAWAKVWDGPRGNNDVWRGVKLAPGGGVVVAGTTDSGHAGDFAAALYSSSGTQGWVRTWSSAGRWLDLMRSLAVAGDGSVWVVGDTDREEGDMRGAVVKWSAAGRRLFARTLGTSRIAADLSSVTLDSAGNACLGGSVQAAGDGGWDLLAAKYDAAGRRLWFSSAGFGRSSQDGLDAIVLGGAGYVYACGTAGWEGPDSRGVVVKIRR